MASRQEEKQRRREERMAAEQAAAAAHRRTRLTRSVLAAVFGVGVVAAIVVVATNGGGSAKNATPNASSGSGAPVPAPRERDLAKAAAAAGCTLKTFPSEGQQHTTSKVSYKTNPPTSGPHDPVPALDGIYDPGNSPPIGKAVHAMEHGRIDVQYRPGTSKQRISQLETLVSEPINGKPAYLTLLFQNPTGMSYAVAATAWTHLLGCRRFTPEVFDALRDFRVKYVDKGPERGIPPNN